MSSETDPGRHRLGPHVVGQRVVVRRLVPGETGPSGGPAMTDLLGVCVGWSDAACVIEAEDGTRTEIPLSLLVSGKPVPPRASVRHRVSARDASLHGFSMWPAMRTQPLGDWVLRTDASNAERFVARSNSVLAMGDPGVPLSEAAAAAIAFYRGLDRPVWAQVVVGSAECTGLESMGWSRARPDEADTAFQVASVAQLARRLGAADSAYGELVEGVEGDACVLTRAGEVVARCRTALDDDWLGLHDIWVSPQLRRQGLARAVMASAVDWGAAQGALTAYLQVRQDNHAALALYDAIGFRTHHAYRYVMWADA